MSLPPAQITLMAAFVTSLKDYYGATEMKNDKGHRQFSNPWAHDGGHSGYIFILRESGMVKFGQVVTRSNKMSDAMIESIAARKQRKPSSVTPEAPITAPPER